VANYFEKLRRGEYDLGWLRSRSEWGVKPTPSARGLTLNDINVGSYGVVPDEASHTGYAPRGCDFDPADSPSMGYTLNRKTEIWANNAAKLYEEAVARQWTAARDVGWDKLQPLREDLERAMCQVCTFLVEVEFPAGDVPSMYLGQINNAFYEVKLFLATQIMDEARHLEVFRKRALANGGGLGKCPKVIEESLRYVLDVSSRSFTQMCARLHLFAEGRILTLFRLGEMIAQNETEKTIFRLCAQDEARHVAFGCLHLRQLIEEDPDRVEEIQEVLDETERRNLEVLGGAPEAIEPFAVLLGGGVDKIEDGLKKFDYIRGKMLQEYLQRCRAIGVNRDNRCLLTAGQMSLL
jgi:hypothetical protein